MVALLVCLILMMNSLRSMREPGPGAQRIISNLDKSLKLVGTTATPASSLPTGADQVATGGGESPAALDGAGALSTASDALPTGPATAPAGDEATTQAESTATEGQSDALPSRAVEGESNAGASNAGESNAGESSKGETPSLNLREDLVLQDWLELVKDGTLKMQKLEMPAYWRILNIVNKSSFADLLKAADSKWRFNDLYQTASKQRSKLLTLKVNIRKVTRYETETNPAGVSELYEVWGWSESTKSWLYVFVTPELPPGLSADTPVNQSATFVGYFFKMQGYYPALAKPNAKPTLAPMMIGNLSCRSQSLLLHRNQLLRSKSSLGRSF